jgi:photosystem II oxygen-evolving enhancer protein 1
VDIVISRRFGFSSMRIRPLLALVLAFCLTFVTACSGDAQAVDRSNITYDDIRNTGKANDCPTLDDSARGSIPLTPGSDYQLRAICMHPSRVFVKGEPANKRQEAQFIEGKILTRYTSSLDQVYGDLVVGEKGLSFKEQGGIDFQPITVLVPGGEEFPFTFSSKNLKAEAEGAAITTSTDFEGEYRTPSYRTSNFIDPKGRALTTGVDYPQGLIGLGGDYQQLDKENVKRYIDGQGVMSLSITKVDPDTGEFAGVFSAIQPSDSDMGGREVVDVKITGELYGQLEES